MFGTPQRRRERGFTLVETMVAVTLLTIGMLGLVGMQITTISATRFSGKMTQAMMIAEDHANRLLTYDWAHADLGGEPKVVVADRAYGQSFIDPVKTDSDPSAVADRCDGLSFDASGQLAPDAVDGATFQRCVQLDPEDLSTAIDGIDAVRIRVFVRFRDIEEGGGWRLASITVVKPKVF